MSNPFVDVSGRRKERARRRLRRRLAIIGIVIVVLGLIGGGVWLVGFSSVLAVNQVDVVGTKLTDAGHVRQAAAIPLGTPLARVDPGQVAQRVQVLKPVESATVRRVWPNTIAIEVKERTVRLVVKSGSRFAWVDGLGVAFHEGERPANIPLVEAPLEDAPLLASVATVAEALPPEVRTRTQKITANSPDSITIWLDKSQRVVWGSSADSGLKAQVIVPLLAQKATVFDVSAPSHPTTR